MENQAQEVPPMVYLVPPVQGNLAQPMHFNQAHHVPPMVFPLLANQGFFAHHMSPPNSALDPLSPYFVHPGEGPGTHLTMVVLDDWNFHAWKRSVKITLKSKNKLRFAERFVVHCMGSVQHVHISLDLEFFEH